MCTCSMKPAAYSFFSCAANVASLIDSLIESVFSLPHWAVLDPVSLTESANAPAASHVPSLTEAVVSFTESVAFDAMVVAESIESLVALAQLSADTYTFHNEQKEEKH
jgi:hypothetical protein